MGLFDFFKKSQKKESAISIEDEVTQKEPQFSNNDEAKNGTKSFEDAFMDIQIGLVSLAMEYIDGHADKAFLYCINEKGMIEFKLFYKIGSNYSLIHEVNNYLEDGKKVDVSREMQVLLLKTGNQDLQKLSDFCKEYGRDCPSEMWLVYDATKGTLDTRYSYEERYEKDEYLQSRNELKKWLEEVRSKSL